MGEGSREHVIVVSGKAERRVQPDRARWSISVEADAGREQEAFSECSRRASELMERLRAVVGDDGEVATAYVRVAPRWEPDRKRYVGFEASTTVTASSQLDVAGKVAQAAMSDAVGHIGGPEFKAQMRTRSRTRSWSRPWSLLRGKPSAWRRLPTGSSVASSRSASEASTRVRAVGST